MILGEDRASQAFTRFERQLNATSRAVDRHNASLSRQRAASAATQKSLSGLVLGVSGVDSAFGLAERRASLFARALAGVNLATGVLEPAMAGLVVTAGALASGMTILGAAGGAYAVAALPGILQVSAAMKAQQTLEKARVTAQSNYTAALAAGTTPQAAAAARTRALTAAQLQYNAAVAGTPAPVRQFAGALQGAGQTWKSWAAGLSGPVFTPLTSGLQLLRPLLNAATPLVKAMASGVESLIFYARQSIEGGGLQQWAQQVAPYVGPVMVSLGRSIAHVAAGIGGIARAFAPVAVQLVQGLDQITARFAAWGQTLTSHSGFGALMRMFREQTPAAMQVLRNLGTVVVNVTGALASMLTPANSRLLLNLLMPLSSVMRALSANQGLVQTVAAFLLFRKVLGPFGPMLGALWKGLTLVRSGTLLATVAQWALNVAMNANPVGIIITALAALGAAFYIAWTKSATFRKILIAAWDAVKDAALAVVRWFSGPFVNFFTVTIPGVFHMVLNWVARNWPWLVGGLTGPIGLVVVWIVKHWSDMWAGVKGAAGAAVQAVRNVIAWMVDRMLGLFGTIIHGAAWAFGWIPGIGGRLRDAAKAFDRFRDQVNAAIRGIDNRTIQVGVQVGLGVNRKPGPGGGYAAGGLVRGPGGPAGDQAGLFWLSDREFVMRAAAVARYGVSFMEALNAGRLAGGGLAVRTSFPSAKSVQNILWVGVLSVAKPAAEQLAKAVSGTGGGVSRWAGVISTVLNILEGPGRQPQDLGLWLSQIATESGGNPYAVNRWDINWQQGHPSVGLAQVIAGTFASYAGPYRGRGPFLYGVSVDPLANIYAGINYAIARYGPGWRSVIGKGHGYGAGGPITEPILGFGLSSGTAYGFHAGETVVPRGGGNTYNINVSVPPTASKADVGRAVVDAIRAFEKNSGNGWRR